MRVRIEIVEPYAGHRPGDRQLASRPVAQRLIDAGIAILAEPEEEPAPRPEPQQDPAPQQPQDPAPEPEEEA